MERLHQQNCQKNFLDALFCIFKVDFAPPVGYTPPEPKKQQKKHEEESGVRKEQ